MKIKTVNILVIFFLFSQNTFSQEVLIPMQENQKARYYYLTQTAGKKATSQDTVELPFIDDFSDSEVEPNPEFWSDKDAYINNRYSSNPVTAGIATLDAFDSNGALYQDASSTPYIADYLTSAPINLNYPASDSIYLSFYYQAKGIGEQPDVYDSLCLDFYNVSEESWDRIWDSPGKVMSEFEQVLLPVYQDEYLQKGFRFRFYNYSTISDNTDYEDEFSNSDHWHLDYIILNTNRNSTDTILNDVSFADPIESMLNDYESIPWDHFEDAYTKQRSLYITTSISNLDDITRNVTKYLRIENPETGYVYKNQSTANDFEAGENLSWDFEYDYPFDFSTESPSIFEISAILETDAFDYKNNDTIRRTQVFDDYYAYDDGSSEYGYGLSGAGTNNAMVAVHFEAFTADSLRAVDIHFNQVKDSINLAYYFYLVVWDNNDGIPGDIIYSQLGVKPEYGDSLNEFVHYELDSAIYLEGDFFLGWKKTVSNLSNIGFDLNKDNRSNNFYNLGSGWTQSIAEGSIMLRPVFSFNPTITEIEKTTTVSDQWTLYPNPANQYIIVESENQLETFSLEIFDISGRLLINVEQYDWGPLSIENLKDGIYLLNISNNNSTSRIQKKFIVRH